MASTHGSHGRGHHVVSIPGSIHWTSDNHHETSMKSKWNPERNHQFLSNEHPTSFWVNYHISLTWIAGPFGDDFPCKPWLQGPVVIIYPNLWADLLTFLTSSLQFLRGSRYCSSILQLLKWRNAILEAKKILLVARTMHHLSMIFAIKTGIKNGE